MYIYIYIYIYDASIFTFVFIYTLKDGCLLFTKSLEYSYPGSTLSFHKPISINLAVSRY